MRFFLSAFLVLCASPAFATPTCHVVVDEICFETADEYDTYMGWSPEQREDEAAAQRSFWSRYSNK